MIVKQHSLYTDNCSLIVSVNDLGVHFDVNTVSKGELGQLIRYLEKYRTTGSFLDPRWRAYTYAEFTSILEGGLVLANGVRVVGYRYEEGAFSLKLKYGPSDIRWSTSMTPDQWIDSEYRDAKGNRLGVIV